MSLDYYLRPGAIVPVSHEVTRQLVDALREAKMKPWVGLTDQDYEYLYVGFGIDSESVRVVERLLQKRNK